MNPNFSSRLTNFLKEIGKVIFKQLSNIFRFLTSTIGYLVSKINNRYRVFGLILLLLWMVIVWGSFILQEKQFLIVDQPETAIRKLRSLQIHPQDPQGIQTFISGKSKEVAVGLYPEFPVQSLQPSFLSKYLSQEAINTILSFIGALFGFFLPYFFTREN